jgi:hypothetical protein
MLTIIDRPELDKPITPSNVDGLHRCAEEGCGNLAVGMGYNLCQYCMVKTIRTSSDILNGTLTHKGNEE